MNPKEAHVDTGIICRRAIVSNLISVKACVNKLSTVYVYR